MVALRGGSVIALGETKLRALTRVDLERLLRIRELLGAREATIVLASASHVETPPEATTKIVSIEPADVYGYAARTQ